MRAATALAPLLKSAAANQVWRADDLSPTGWAGIVSSGFPALDAELPGSGWPQGALTELLIDTHGLGELSLLLPALSHATRSGRPCVWTLPFESAAGATDQPLPYAPALAAAGLDLDRSIFVQPATPRENLWALEQSLRMPHLGALIGWLPPGHADADFRALRRLHLLASRYQALVFVLRSPQAATAPSPAALRLLLACHDGRLDVTLLKRRGRPLLEPITLQMHPERWNESLVVTTAQPSTTPAEAHNGSIPAPALPARRWSMHAIFSH
jgi:cell division inhibitor SulA/protein ImuA